MKKMIFALAILNLLLAMHGMAFAEGEIFEDGALFISGYDMGDALNSASLLPCVFKYYESDVTTFIPVGADNLVFDSKGNLFARSGNMIYKIFPGGSFIELLPSDVFSGMGYLTVDNADNLYFLRSASGETTCDIIQITENGAVITPKLIQTLTTGARKSSFGGLAVDANGNFFVGVQSTDGVVRVIKEITPQGEVTDFATMTRVFSDIKFDQSGNLFAAWTNDLAVEKIAPDGTRTIYNLPVTGVIRQLTINSAGEVYVAAYDSGDIRERPEGYILKVKTDGSRQWVLRGFINPYAIAVAKGLAGDPPPASTATLATQVTALQSKLDELDRLVNPTLSILNPSDGSTVNGVVSIDLSSNNLANLTYAYYYIDGIYAGSRNSAPWSFPWDSRYFQNSSHQIKVCAYFNGYQTYKETSITVTTNNEELYTPLAITSVVNGQTVSGTITINTSAVTPQFTYVYLYVDGVYKAWDGTAPFSFTLNTAALSNGTHEIKVMGYYNSKGFWVSDKVNVTVSN